MSYSICIVGIGGGGCSVVNHVATIAPMGPRTVAIDTDARSLRDAQATAKLEIGSEQAKGVGSGGDANIGKLAAEDSIEMIRTLFVGADLVIIALGLGGGTGAGATPVVLKAARDAGALTLCLATLPFNFEAERKKMQAERMVAGIKDIADVLMVVPNDKLLELIGETSVAGAFDKTDEILGAGIFALWKLISEPEYISVDFADFQKLLANSGATCAFGYGQGKGSDKAEKAIASFLHSALVNGGEIVANARAMLVGVMGGKDLAVAELQSIREAISAKVQKDCHVFLGTVVDDAWEGRVSIIALISEYWSARGEKDGVGDAGKETRSIASKSEHGGKKPHKPGQTQLLLDPGTKGRFKDAVPTIMDGEDLDIPTFVRRGIVIEK